MNGTNLRISLNSPGTLRLNLSGNEAERIRMLSPSSGFFSGKISIDTTERWGLKPTYIPAKGEIVIYSDYNIIDGTSYPGIKIGDGKAYIVDLPFFVGDIKRIVDIVDEHINNALIHVSEEDRAFWNAKLNCEMDGENLIFTRN